MIIKKIAVIVLIQDISLIDIWIFMNILYVFDDIISKQPCVSQNSQQFESYRL